MTARKYLPNIPEGSENTNNTAHKSLNQETVE